MTSVETLYKEAVQAMRDYDEITDLGTMSVRERDHVWSVVNDPNMPATTMIHCHTGRSIRKDKAALMFGVELPDSQIPDMPDIRPVTKENITKEELDTLREMFNDNLIRVDSIISFFTGRKLSGKEALAILSAGEISFGRTSHYNQYEGFEVIDVCEQLRSFDDSGNFNRGNAFKYLARAGWKDRDKEVQDLEKAVNYIEREIKRIKARNGEA